MAVDTNCDDREMIYDQYLQELCGTKFTFREIDVIACILHNRGEKKIGSLLAISDRTVSSHVRNIMNKLGFSSRDYIIDLVEKSGKLQYFRKYYFQLVLQNAFEKQLQKISSLINRSGIACSVDFVKVGEEGTNLLQQIEEHLKLANVTLAGGKQKLENTLHNICIVSNSSVPKSSQNNNIYLLLDNKTDLSIFNQLEYIDFTNRSNYYLSILLLLKKIIIKPELDTIIEKFKEEQDALKNSLEGKNAGIVDQTFDQDEVKENRYKFIAILLILSVATVCSLLLWFFMQKQSISAESVSSTTLNKAEEWNLPLPMEHYTERTELMNTIWKQFKQDENGENQRKTAILVGLHGLGGIGKTTLAKNAIHHPQQHYSFKGWFSAETKDLLQADYFELGEKHHLFTEGISVKQKIVLVKEWLEKQPNILLVYDNAPDMDILEEYLPNRGDIIITSRNPNLPRTIEIDVMAEDEAIKLLDNLLPPSVKQDKNYNNDLKILAKTLGYLPLALSQAGAYIAGNVLAIQEYLSLYSTEKDKLLSDKTMPAMDKHQPAYISWDMSIRKLRQQENGDKAIDVLDLIACCYPENIPNKLLAQYLYDKTDNEAIVNLNELLTLLKKYSLIKTSANSVSIHRLVHSWLGSKLSEERKPVLLQKAVEAIKVAYQWKHQTMEDIAFIKLLLPHAEALLEQIQTVASEIDHVHMFFVIGNSCYEFGNYVKSEEMFIRALSVNKKLFGENSVEVVRALIKLGTVYVYLGKYKESEELLEKALAIQQKHYGSEHIKTAYILCSLGRVYMELGKYKESQELLEKALAIEQKHYGLEHIQPTYALSTLGTVYVCLGKYKESQELLEKSLAIQQKHYGLEHKQTVYTLNQLGGVYKCLGRYSESKELLEKALIIKQRDYGSNHVQTAYILSNLAKVYLVIGKYKESKELLEKSLAIEQKHYGLEHVGTARTLNSLGLVYLAIGKYKESKELLEKALAIEQKYYGSEHVETAYTLHNLGRVYIYLGKYKESKELLEKALAIEQKYYGQEHIFTAAHLESLGSYYLVSGDYVKAKELFTISHSIINKFYGKANIFTIKSTANLANIYRLLNDFQQSKELLEESLVLIEKLHDYDNIIIAKIIWNLGLVYGQLGDNKKRKEYLEKTLVIFKEHLPEDHIYINQIITNLKDKDNNTYMAI